MLDSEEGVSSVDNLFYDGPVIHKVKPLCQGQGSWIFDAPPSLSQIPATQDIQGEAAHLFSLSYSQKSKKFLPPAQKPIHNPIASVQGQTVKSHELEESVLWTHEPSRERDQSVDRTRFMGTRPLPTASAPPFKTRAPTRRISGNDEDVIANQMMSTTNDTGFPGQVTMTTTGSQTTHAVATCSPFIDLGQTAQTSDVPSKTSHTAKFRSVFKDFPCFNYVQSRALDDVLYTNKNFVACAPTGSGKTVLFELAIVRLLIEASDAWHNVRAVYMAPIKALCSQRFENWKQKFGPLGLNCKELTGDTEIDDIFEIQDAHLIFTTPEKWDSMTRRWRDNCLLPSVSLFLIDEIHVVKDKTRGATLEVVVSRMKTMHSYHLAVNPESKASMRFVAVSATIPNIQDVSEWLSDESGPATCLEMDESHRPVKLRKVVLGFPCGSNQNEFRFDLSLNYKMANVIQTYSDQKPTLVFCSTRKGVQQSASVLAKDARFIMSIDHKQRYHNLFICGIGYHHAGMDVSDRKIIEEAFTVVTTSTLAMGVNLPAHLVVIKSTSHYVGGACEEYSEADLLQMIGRAGRPQFDTTATAVIMTRAQTKDKYTHFLSGIDSIESSLHTNLVEHLNAEIVLQTISDVNMALDWIRSTFLYIRVLKNPKHYGFSPQLDKCGIETKLQELCLKNLNSLASFNLITMDEDINIKPTETGKLMARYCVAFDTVKQFSRVTGTETLLELIEMISKGKEFSDVQLRLGCIPIQEFGLIQDIGKIFRNGNRVSRYLTEFLSHHSKSNFSAQLNSLILAKCFRAKLWENSPYVSRQLERIGLTLANAMIVNRHPPFGNQIKESVSKLPKYEVSLEQISVTVNLMNFKEMASKQTAPDHHYVTLIIGDCDNNVVFQQKIQNTLLLKSGSWSKKIEVTRTPKGEELSIHLISSEYVGLDVQQEYRVCYSAKERFGAESCIREKPTWRVQRIHDTKKTEDTTLTAPTSSNIGKVGVMKTSVSFTSYLNNLKIRNERLCETPVKRLKMRMNYETAAESMQQFTYKPKDTLPAAKKFEESRGHIQSTYEIKETPHENSSFESYHGDYNDEPGDFYSEIGDPELEDPQPLALPQRVLFHSQLEPHNNGQMHRISANKASVYTTHANPEHSADSDHLLPGFLDVTFDLGVNDWDDFDDGNLVDASDVCYESQVCNPVTDHDQPSNAGLASASQYTAENRQGTTTAIVFQSPADLLIISQAVCSEISMESLSNQGQAKTPSFQRRFEFFTKTDAPLKESTSVSRFTVLTLLNNYRDHTNDICNETSIFLGMFDGLF
ncbi:putative ATP-dependent DNA helicase HFM1 [Labeo rohita]|uniref:DNA 3'-5' helicase n=1 Tax=Labeo rohita TaxID=84645 RepID=A0ABQ8MXD8_LABRO|nr:putative ATP-dependent DNA helicase HFM1 [Labeo rohita]